jgi:hypothetical protein
MVLNQDNGRSERSKSLMVLNHDNGRSERSKSFDGSKSG